ncbi:MAG: RNA helicase [Firmicutes bacterium HGW-Firmicutes-8]|nr:MAG: RNA helicase [Firmicutes bacterium HGW-Firmicutes-8]
MMEMKKFGDLKISKKVFSAISDMGFEEPTPIQMAAIPLLMEGWDVIGQAQTGTGKTAAFAIPIIEKLNPKLRSVQALVITPTRELAIQVAEEVAKIGKSSEVRTLAIYGGQSIDRQIMALKRGVHIAVGTPGRIMDHLRRKTLKLNDVLFMVLDEADEMLDMGFIDDIETILRETPEDKQTLLFSATMPDEIQRLARRYLRDPKVLSVSRDELTVPLTEQVFYEVKEHNKLDGLCRVLDTSKINLAIIFCRTKRGVDELVAGLEARGYEADGLHGDLNQAQRNRVMKKFREGQVEIMVATDVAARGLDIENVSHVINYDIPQDPESYVHRIGRTGRAGKSGIAISFVIPREYRQFRMIEKLINTRIKRGKLPTFEDVFERQKEVIVERLVATIQKGKLNHYQAIVEDMAEDYETMEIAAAALKLAFDVEGSDDKTEPDETEFGDTGAEAGMVRLFMNIGRADDIRPPDLVRTIAEEAGIPGRVIGAIRIYDKFAFVEIPREVAEKVIYSLHRSTIKGKRIHIEPAKVRAR